MHKECDRRFDALYLFTMSVIKNQRGSVLLVVFTASVVIAALMPSMYFLILSSAKNQVKRGDAEAYVAMIQALRTQIEDPLQCHLIMGGLTVPGSFQARLTNLSLPWTYGGSSSTVLARGWKVPNTMLTVQDVVLLRSGASGGTSEIKTGGSLVTYTTVPLRLYVYPKEMALNFADQASGDTNPPELLRPMIRKELMIRFLANVDASGKIYNCFGQQTFAGACQAAGGAYNHLGPVDMKCQPDKVCFTGSMGLTNNPGVCASASSIPYKPMKIGNELINPLYICQLCSRDL